MDPENRIFTHDFVEKIIDLTEEDEEDKGFSLKKTVAVMKHITEVTDIFKSSTSTLLGKREKEGTYPLVGERRVKTWYGCGKVGHFARDNQ